MTEIWQRRRIFRPVYRGAVIAVVAASILGACAGGYTGVAAGPAEPLFWQVSDEDVALAEPYAQGS